MSSKDDADAPTRDPACNVVRALGVFATLCAALMISACNRENVRAADSPATAAPPEAVAQLAATNVTARTDVGDATSEAPPAIDARAEPTVTTPTPAPTDPPVADIPRTDPGAPEPIGTVVFHESSITIPTYPVERFQSDALSPVYSWPYRRTDMEAFAAADVAPVARTYKTLVLENHYLLITILPELGGRILQVEFKPTGTRMFYNNRVVKPTVWGPREQGGWLALGGLEWDLPVEEHGYGWGEPWGYIPLVFGPERAAVTVFTPQDGRALSAAITIELLAGAAAFTIDPVISNVSGTSQRFDYWHNAMLAPGSGAGISPAIHFVLPTTSMMVHSTGDARLPSGGQQVTWPVYAGRDVSRLDTWAQYAGLFEAPAANGPFAAVYDTQQDAGVVRVFPASVAQGSKIFALGGSLPLDPALYTDDSSAYVELHGGLAPTFAQQTELPPGESVSWRETWYPVAGMGDLAAANELVALNVTVDGATVAVAVHAVHPIEVDVVLLDRNSRELARTRAALAPATTAHVTWQRATLAAPPAAVRIESAQGLVLAYSLPAAP